MKGKKGIALFLSLLCVVFSLCSCSDKGQIQRKLKQFEGAANLLNTEDMMELIYPKTADMIESAAGVVAFFTGDSSDELLDALAENLFGFSGDGMFSSLQIQTKDILIDGNEATAKAILSYQNNGELVETEGTFYFKYYAEDWYLSGFLPG